MSSPDAPEDKPLKGHERIAAYLKTLPDAPGVYRMMNAAGDVLYVGKAKSLKKRVSSYARGGVHSERLARMIAETAEMLFLTTESETEALLLTRVSLCVRLNASEKPFWTPDHWPSTV